MELKVHVDYTELISLIRQLPAKQIAQLKVDLSGSQQIERKADEKEAFQQFLLSGPVMSDDEFATYQQRRDWMNQWRAE